MINTSLTLAPKWMREQGGGRQPGQILMQALQFAHQVDVDKANQNIAVKKLALDSAQLKLQQTQADNAILNDYARLQMQTDQAAQQAEVMAATREDAAEMNKAQMARQKGETYTPVLRTPEFQRTYAIWRASDAEAKADQKIIDRYTDIVLWDPTAKAYINKGTDGWMERLAEIGGEYDAAMEQRQARGFQARYEAQNAWRDSIENLGEGTIKPWKEDGKTIGYMVLQPNGKIQSFHPTEDGKVNASIISAWKASLSSVDSELEDMFNRLSPERKKELEDKQKELRGKLEAVGGAQSTGGDKDPLGLFK